MHGVSDNFGKRPSRKSFKGRAWAPQDSIRSHLADLDSEPQRSSRDVSKQRSSLDVSSLVVHVGEERRARRPIAAWSDAAGSGRPLRRAMDDCPRAVRTMLPPVTRTPQKGTLDGAKRCFDWNHKPTGYDNPEQFEEPVSPGVRPSHPVGPVGLVSQGHRRCFPDRALGSTLPGATTKAAKNGAEWGGWAVGGAPGRAPMRQPWEVAAVDGSCEDTFRVADARRRKRSDLKFPSTASHTMWHTHPHTDIDPLRQAQIHFCTPLPSTAAAEELLRPMAGKPSLMVTEGAALHYYDALRTDE